MTKLYRLVHDPAFERRLPGTLNEEGPHPINVRDPRNYSDPARDRGRGTMDGITQQPYERAGCARPVDALCSKYRSGRPDRSSRC